jgi:hypothetical protein
LESDANIYQEWVDKLETRQKDQDSGLAKLLDASISVEAFTDAFFQDIQVVSNPKVDVPMKEDGTELFEKSEQYRQLMTKKFGKVKSSAKSVSLNRERDVCIVCIHPPPFF